MKIVLFFLLLAFSPFSLNCLAQGIKTPYSNLDCDGVLGLISNLRNEILTANKQDLKSGRPQADVSNFIEIRAKDIDSSLVAGSHVISLGSGADIYLPLYLYPTAKYFHLVDLLSGWGRGPDEVVEEIEARLQSIAPNVQIERLDSLGDWRHINSMLPEALIWRLRWQSPSAGPQEKIFFLHQMNFSDPQNHALLQSLFQSQKYHAKLGGIVATGVGANLETRRFFLSNLQAGGSMFTEMLYVNEAGETSSPEDQEILQKLQKDFDMVDLGKVVMKTVYVPHLFLITPKK